MGHHNHQMCIRDRSLDADRDVESIFADCAVKSVKGTVLTGAMDAHNTFEEGNAVSPREFEGCSVDGNTVRFTIPARSVLHLEVEI